MTDQKTEIIKTHHRPKRAAKPRLFEREDWTAVLALIFMSFTAGMLGGILTIYITHWI